MDWEGNSILFKIFKMPSFSVVEIKDDSNWSFSVSWEHHWNGLIYWFFCIPPIKKPFERYLHKKFQHNKLLLWLSNNLAINTSSSIHLTGTKSFCNLFYSTMYQDNLLVHFTEISKPSLRKIIFGKVLTFYSLTGWRNVLWQAMKTSFLQCQISIKLPKK